MSTDGYIYKAVAGAPGEPVLFLFHGTGGDENQLVSLGQEMLPGASIISPRGDVSEYGAARFFRRTGRMAAFVRARVEAQKPSAVLGLGYSNGANILASTVFLEPDLFDTTVLMHPLIPFEPQVKGSLAGKRILITAGRRDPICPPDLTARLDAHLRSAGADVTMHWHEGGHEIRPVEIEAARRFLATAQAKEQ
jgi:phospholipase/carboxylesterase